MANLLRCSFAKAPPGAVPTSGWAAVPSPDCGNHVFLLPPSSDPATPTGTMEALCSARTSLQLAHQHRVPRVPPPSLCVFSLHPLSSLLCLPLFCSGNSIRVRAEGGDCHLVPILISITCVTWCKPLHLIAFLISTMWVVPEEQ